MSLADHIFIDMCNDILTNGTSTEGFLPASSQKYFL